MPDNHDVLEGDAVADGTYAVAEIKKLSYRAAQSRFHISYPTWKAIVEGKRDAYVPSARGRPLPEGTFLAIVESVRVNPTWSTQVRAARLGVRVQTCQNILKSQHLNRAIARLRYAGFTVEAVQPLAAARLRRVVALGLGCYTSTDFKSYGMVRGREREANRPLRGCVCVDQLSGLATVCLSDKEDGALASRTLRTHAEKVKHYFGIKLNGVVLSDNGLAFMSEPYSQTLADLGLVPRWTRPNHPWSNGKAEAWNKKLKYHALPAICTGMFSSIADIEKALDIWMREANERSYYGGWINKGLPPVEFGKLWLAAPGKPFERLVRLGIVGEDDLKYVRVMGVDKEGNAFERESNRAIGTAFALVIDRNRTGDSYFKPLTHEPNDAKIRYYEKKRTNVTFQK